ncbi:3-hydroxybutyrate dehydrogenase type 2-like [Eriocheir sinensis]|uniref:3-hydroxybutyrate dehydrogenase type 2-like n=1 Tax=Eriocheir sinensis TaxID=95602 RepID=UPI0021C9D43D|nr:3-hydroxybutyrate dehydrogenase type 2-like [Eriocheir sinensis]
MSGPRGRLTGKRCLVTGAGQGIGLAAVEAFLREGAALVVAIDVNAEELNKLSSDRVERRVLDVRNTEGLKALAQDYPDIDVLFNCVGYVALATLLEFPEEEWDKTFDINVKSTFILCKAFIPKMISRGGGSIINMASVSSSMHGFERRSVYGAAKGAVIGLTKGIAREHVHQGIRCNIVCPGLVDTPGSSSKVGKVTAVEKKYVDHLKNNLIGRLARAEEVANLCVYLASDEASYHTGSEFVIDGGLTI